MKAEEVINMLEKLAIAVEKICQAIDALKSNHQAALYQNLDDASGLASDIREFVRSEKVE